MKTKGGLSRLVGKLKTRLTILTILLAVALIGVGALILPIQDWREDRAAQHYDLLAKRINIANPNDTLINFAPLRHDIDADLQKVEGRYSFYFEYLPTGTAIRRGLNNDGEGLIAASLMKLPFVMDLYKGAEEGKINLDQEVTIKPEWLNQGYGDLWKRGAGAKVTNREAANLALNQSDNTAMRVVLTTVNERKDRKDLAITRLDLPFLPSSDTPSVIGARSYSSVLKCLYFACYLNKDDSQELLNVLTTAPANNQIRSGLPADVKVAHKIGVYGSNVNSDCGIVYVPLRPYILCMMFESSADKADPHMQALSKIVYDYIQNPR